MTIDNTAITTELQAQYASDKPASYAHYALRLIEKLYKARQVEETPVEASLTARIQVEEVASGIVTVEALLREDVAYAYTSAAELRSQAKLALVMASSQALTFAHEAGDGYVTVTGPNLPTAGIEAGMYVKAKVRGGFPRTKGVQVIAKTGEGTKCRVEAKVSERAISVGRIDGTFAYGSVEWPVASATSATAIRFVGQAFADIEKPGVDFTDKVAAGDIVRVLARAAAPATVNPAFVGYYTVIAAGLSFVRVSATRLTRTSEGVYAVEVPAAAMPEFEDNVDVQVVRTRQDVTYLRDAGETFAGIGADDWVRNTQSPRKVFKVLERLSSGLLLLENKQYTGNQAPYTLVGPVGSTFGTNLWNYGIYRAPLGKMAIFRITDPDANFNYVRVGDMVKLKNRSGLLDPTANTSKVPGIYKVASVPSANVINLESTRHDQVGNQFVADGTFYETFNDNAAYEAYRFAQAFPHAALYKVTSVGAGYVRLQMNFFNGYAGYAGVFTQGGAVDVFDDVMDADFLRVHDDALALIAAGTTLNVKIQPGDYITLVRRTVAPATQRAGTGDTFRVASSPRKDVLLLERQRLRGDFIDAGARRAPYLTFGSQLTGEWADACDFTATRVFPGEYRFALATVETGGPLQGFFAAARAGDYMEVASGPAQTIGAWMVEAKVSDNQLRLKKDALFSRLADVFTPAVQTISPFRENLPIVISRYADHVTEMYLERAGGWGDATIWLYNDSNHDVFTFVYDGVERTFASMAIVGNILYLHPRFVTGSNGSYVLGALNATAFATELVQVTRIRPVEDLDITNAYLNIFRTLILPNDKRQVLDRMVNAIVPPNVSDRYSDTMLAAARMACDQVSYISDTAVSVKGSSISPSVARDALPPFEFQPDEVLLKQDAFQQAVAVAVSVDFDPGYLGKTFSELKDLYVDARLREDGFTALSAYAAAAGVPPGVRRMELALAAVGKMFVAKNQDAVESALRQRNRADLITSFNNQITNLKAIVASLLPAGFANADRMFVKDDPIPIADSLLFLIPFTTLGKIKNPSARERRDALKGMISVPADRTLRAKRRSYALRKNHANKCATSAEDTTRHLTVATDPAIVTALSSALSVFQSCTTSQGALADDIGEDLDAQGSERPEIFPSVDPNDQQAFSQSYASVDTPPAAQMQLVVRPTPAVPFPSTAAQPVAADAAGGDGVIVPVVRDGNITNLFDNDVQDFRQTGIVLPLDFLDQDPGKNNRDRLSSIFLVDSNGTPVSNFAMKAAGKPRTNVYNHFILQKWDETHIEKVQLQDTLGDGFVLNTFGAAPQAWSLSGVLLNDILSDQLVRFRDLWDSDLRASKLAKNGYKMAINVPAAGIIVLGYGINLQLSVDANGNEGLVPFAMQFIVARWYPLPLINHVDANKMGIARKLTEMNGGRVFSRLRPAGQPAKAALATPRASNLLDSAKAKAGEALTSLLDPGLRQSVSGLGINFFG